MQCIYFIDMDGVLVKYDRTAYIGENPRYLQKGAHYFRNLPHDPLMLQVVEELCSDPDIGVRICTNVSNDGELYAEQIGDKILWLQRNCPFINTDLQFIPSISNKRNIVAAITNPATGAIFPNYILIDDYNPNLEAWRHAGGTAVKYLNGINSPDSYTGLTISGSSNVNNIMDALYALQETIS